LFAEWGSGGDEDAFVKVCVGEGRVRIYCLGGGGVFCVEGCRGVCLLKDFFIGKGGRCVFLEQCFGLGEDVFISYFMLHANFSRMPLFKRSNQQSPTAAPLQSQAYLAVIEHAIARSRQHASSHLSVASHSAHTLLPYP
jgi:hypothetical protein